jgi:hypothetical protein
MYPDNYFVGAADGNRTHVGSLGSLLKAMKNAQIGGFLSFFGFLKWIPIGAAGSFVFEGVAVPQKHHRAVGIEGLKKTRCLAADENPVTIRDTPEQACGLLTGVIQISVL